MANSSDESLIMTLLEQIRALEDERDKALQLVSELEKKVKLGSKSETDSHGVQGIDSPSEESETKLEKLKEENEVLKGTVESMAQAVIFDLEEIRLNEEQRRFNLKELICEEQNHQSEESSKDMDADGYKTMLDMCKKYYGKMVAELQDERGSLQQKVEKQQALLLEKDMKIAELELKLQQGSRKWNMIIAWNTSLWKQVRFCIFWYVTLRETKVQMGFIIHKLHGDKYGYNNEIKLGAPDQVN